MNAHIITRMRFPIVTHKINLHKPASDHILIWSLAIFHGVFRDVEERSLPWSCSVRLKFSKQHNAYKIKWLPDI